MLRKFTSIKKAIPVLLLVAFLCFFYFCKIALAKDARPTNVEIANIQDRIYLFMKIENAFNEELKTAVLSGVPVSFSFYIYLEKVKNFFPNSIIRDKQITHTISYDTLKKEFSVKRPWENEEPIITSSFEEAQKLMSEINSMRLVKLRKLNKGDLYQIKIKAKLNKLSLPYHLDYIFFLLARWDFETDWYTLKFIY